MTEETRRSGRATKGQYTKDRDVIADAPPNRKGNGKAKGKGSKAKAVDEEEENEEDAIIRCVCGKYDEEEEVERAMICCDNCDAWQHNDCMGLPADFAPDKYFCEQCKPENHKKLVAAIKRGEKPWEEVARQREAAAEAELAKKKGGKKGRKSGVRSSEVTTRASQDVEESGTPTASLRGGSGSSKRKMEEPPAGEDLKGVKKARSSETPSDTKVGARAPSLNRKPSAVSTPSRQASKSELGQGPVVANVNELTNGQRRNAAAHLSKMFVDQTKSAVKQGAYTVEPGATAEDHGTRLGLHVEHALYIVQSGGSGEPSEPYKAQMKTIMFNVKKNQDLRDRLLSGEVTPYVLASMDAKDMASADQQKRDAAIKKEMEKQHTIVQEQGPRIRRTHKGDEYVDESQQIAEESTTSHAPVRKESGMTQTMDAAKSPDTAFSSPESASKAAPSQARRQPSTDPQRKSSTTNFDIDSVWSNVQGSPGASQTRFPELRQSPAAHSDEPAGPGTRADADIDALLKDEDAESPPYSPKDYADGGGIVWRGRVNGNVLGTFHGAAKYAAGVDIAGLGLTYQQLIPHDILIGGRIDPTKADEYLCGLQYSQTSDCVVVSIAEPENSYDQAQFNKLFDYFKSKNRYGVGIQHDNPAIKDIYFIPLEIGQDIPGLLQLLESDRISSPATERMLLVPFVIKNTELSRGAAPPTPVMQTPITPYDGPQEYHGNVPYQQNPMNGTSALQSYPPAQHAYATPPPALPNAANSAQQVLGPELAKAPAVLQLIAQAPNAGLDEMNVVKECIMANPAAARDLSVLTEMLEGRMYDDQPRPDSGPTGGGPAGAA